jgi:hypothetical protein
MELLESSVVLPQAYALAEGLCRVVGKDIWARRWDARNVQLGGTGAKFWCTAGAQ